MTFASLLIFFLSSVITLELTPMSSMGLLENGFTPTGQVVEAVLPHPLIRHD
jgi:hypothetical protein